VVVRVLRWWAHAEQLAHSPLISSGCLSSLLSGGLLLCMHSRSPPSFAKVLKVSWWAGVGGRRGRGEHLGGLTVPLCRVEFQTYASF